MDDPAQARAYAGADFATVNAGFVERFRTEFPAFVRGRIADLGCGPADIPIRLLRACPGVRLVALDASAPMLALADAARRAAGLRCDLVRARLPNLPFPAHVFDAVISNSLLHHLPEPTVFWRELTRLAAAGAAVVVMDLARPDSPAAAQAIVDAYAADEPPLLRRDFFHSLCAAFTLEEIRAQVAPLGGELRCAAVSDRHWLVTGRAAW
jgi:ubiquinone/menaquinone biosynthesis C-methylase UbiE